MKTSRLLFIFLLVSCTLNFAREDSGIILLWPSPAKPALKLSFGKFKQVASYAGQNTYVSDVTIENLTDKPIPRALFTVYLMDKANVRIGDGLLQAADVAPAQHVKTAFQFTAIGVPASLLLSAKKEMLSGKTVPLNIISVPPGAHLRVDGQDGGVTPTVAKLGIGSHVLEFSKEGYSTGSTPVEIGPDELPGGSITFELGGLSRDTIELRDGTVLLGDVVSVSMTSVVLRVDGREQMFDRNRVKKIILVEREITPAPSAPAGTPAQPEGR